MCKRTSKYTIIATLTHHVSQSSSSQRRGDKKRKRKKWRHHLQHQSYVVVQQLVSCTAQLARHTSDKSHSPKPPHIWKDILAAVPSDSICVILTKLLLRNIEHRWWSKIETSHYGGVHIKKSFAQAWTIILTELSLSGDNSAWLG